MTRLCTMPLFVIAMAIGMAMSACGGGEIALPPSETPQDTIDQETGPDVVGCVCNAETECCDGCHPINKGEFCGIAPRPCMERGRCMNGVCGAAVPKRCEPSNPCFENGRCDPETEACVFDQRPDGATCTARDGVEGSGLCVAGDCQGFGTCDHRVYTQPTNFPCNVDAECEGGLCLSWGDEWTTWCSRLCGPDLPSCPDDMACVLMAGRHVCKPLNEDRTLPRDGSLPAYAPCNLDEDCESTLCLQAGTEKFCASPCTGANGKADDDLCEPCGRCRSDGDDAGFIHPNYCVPTGSLGVGELCQMQADCKRRYCHDGYCSDSCIQLGEVSNCPEGLRCILGAFPDDEEMSICVREDEVEHALGAPCLGDYACLSGVCRDVGGVDRCVADCETASCAEGICVEEWGDFSCLPDDMVGTVLVGGACVVGFECEEGLVCRGGRCLEPCESDEECDGGVCFGDVFWSLYYCSASCGEQAPCPGGLECLDGGCVLSLEGTAYLHSSCRMDRDCESGSCVNGRCTDACTADFPCEGATAPTEIDEFTCKPCNPALFDMDCNPAGSFMLNACVEGTDGHHFCARDCLFFPGCPVGTRCYSIGGASSVCAPMAGTCRAMVGCSPEGWCMKPANAIGACASDAECSPGTCTDGLCQDRVCERDFDCLCGLLQCDDGRCVVDETRAILEVENNGTVAQAQVLGPEVHRVSASLYPSNGVADRDLFRVSLDVGQVLDVRTEPLCDRDADTFLRLLTADGTPIEGWENDDIDPSGYFFSILFGYVASVDEDVLIEVTQSPYVFGMARTPYVLRVDVATPVAADTCGGAPLAALGTERHDLMHATNDYAVSTCVDWAAAGKDQAFRVEVPAHHAVSASVSAPFDAQLYAVTDCASPDATCVAGADVVLSAGTEALSWVNGTDAAVNLYLIVDSFLLDDETWFDLTVEVAEVTAPENDLVAGAVTLASGVAVSGTLVGANSEHQPAIGTCVTVDLAGADVYYRIPVNSGDVVEVEVKRAVGFTPVLVLTRNPTTPASCLGSGLGYVAGVATADEDWFLVIDAATTGNAGAFDVVARVGPAGDCFGPCDVATAEWSCLDAAPATGLCVCDATRLHWRAWDCDRLCKDDGYPSGTCHTLVTPGFEGATCLCDSDCTNTIGECLDGLYTNCTCDASDPCGWQNNAVCNAFCANEYPDNHFDDEADCAPAP